MTSAAVTLPAAAAAAAARSGARGLWTGFVEFLLVGGVTLLLLPLAWCLRSLAGLDASELAVGFLAFHAAYLINDPHFAVTYLLFYKDAKNRALGKSFEPSAASSLFDRGAAWCRSRSPRGGSRGSRPAPRGRSGLLFELMFLLVGWHYVKQGFGVLTVLSARRGVRFSALERKVVLAHCYAGWAYAWANPASASKEVEEKGVVYTRARAPAGARADRAGGFRPEHRSR